MAAGTPGRAWRLLDTGVLSAAENIALDATLLELRAGGKIPDTIRFLKFDPAAALVGYHQSVSQEVRESFCRDRGIDINRRVTGGGAIFFDTSQIGWEVIAGRGSLPHGVTMAQLTAAVCQAAMRGLARLGIPARFRPRNDIEVEGRKISGTGGAWEGDAYLFQGTLLVDFDAGTMLRALRVPTEKLTRHELDSARERVTCVRDCLPALPPEAEIKAALAAGFSEHFGIELAAGGLSPGEVALAGSRTARYASAEWVGDSAGIDSSNHLLTSVRLSDGGTIRTAAGFDLSRGRLKSVLFTGDFFINPRRFVYDLETRLRDCHLDELGQVIADFFRERQPDCPGLTAGDFTAAIHQARRKLDCTRYGLTEPEADAVSVVATGNLGIDGALSRVGAVLLPYCAKRPDCEYRFKEGCGECGECGVGEAFTLARARGIEPVTIQSFEHLEQVFAGCRAGGVDAYIGCCCEAFMVKHNEAFDHAGMAGILIDVDDETCYDLGREDTAYAGRFTGQTRLKIPQLAALLEHLPATTRHAPPAGATGFEPRQDRSE